MNDQEIIEKVKDCIAKLHKDFMDANDYWYEIDAQAALYHFICEEIPELFKIKNVDELNPKFKGRQIYLEFETNKKYLRNNKKNYGRFDLVVFSEKAKIEKTANPLVGIELKYNFEATETNFRKDFEKLNDEENEVYCPILIYIDSDKKNNKYIGLFSKLQKEFNKVEVYYLYKDGIEVLSPMEK